MRFTRMVAGDRERYLELATAFYASPAVLHGIPRKYMERTFDEMMRSSTYVDGFLIEADDGAVMGYVLTAKSFSQECGGMDIWVEEVYVLPEYQGQGAGTSVLALLEEYYPECRRFRLEIEPDNLGAERLYERLGYEALSYKQMIKDKPD